MVRNNENGKSRIELWESVYEFLSVQRINVNRGFCKEEITTHPDYPALTSVVDFLDSGGMYYKAVQTDQSHIGLLNYPVLAHIRQTGNEFIHLVSKIEDWEIDLEIAKSWSGIVIYPEKGSKWQNEQNLVYQSDSLKTKLLSAFAIFISLGLYTFAILHFNVLFYNLFGLFSLLGLGLSFFLLGTELGIQSQIVKQVCGAVSNGGCDKVMKSVYAQGFAGITPADASITYFASQFLLYLISCWVKSLNPTLIILSLFGALISIWSIYTQAVKLKQFCALCLSIVFILTIHFILALILILNGNLIKESAFIILDYTAFFSIYILFLLLLFPIKNLIKVNKSNHFKLAELKKWKLDSDLFLNLLSQEQEVDTTIWENDLIIGNPDAPILITVACNPYCNPCAKAHKQLDKIINKFPGKVKLQIRILFNIDDPNDRRTIAAKAILQIAENNINTTKMINDWFDLFNLNEWQSIWFTDLDIEVYSKLELHSNWVRNSNIKFTPTLFINGRKMPGRYNIDDLELLVPILIV